jgi:RNA polymerase sigma-70 factor (ECF subfamily)
MQLGVAFFHGGAKILPVPKSNRERGFSSIEFSGFQRDFGLDFGIFVRPSLSRQPGLGMLRMPGDTGVLRPSLQPDADPKGFLARLPMTNTSATLLQRLLDHGDDAAWTRLTQLYEPLIRGNLRQHLPQEADVDDVVQQVFTVVMEKLPEFRHNGRPGAFRTWLRRICVNRVRMFWRTRPATVPEAEAALQQLEDPDSALSRQWDREHDEFVFRQALQMIEREFKPSTWQAFCRLALDNAEPEVVAAELGLSANAVYIARSRVLRRLRKEFAGLL